MKINNRLSNVKKISALSVLLVSACVVTGVVNGAKEAKASNFFPRFSGVNRVVLRSGVRQQVRGVSNGSSNNNGQSNNGSSNNNGQSNNGNNNTQTGASTSTSSLAQNARRNFDASGNNEARDYLREGAIPRTGQGSGSQGPILKAVKEAGITAGDNEQQSGQVKTKSPNGLTPSEDQELKLLLSNLNLEGAQVNEKRLQQLLDKQEGSKTQTRVVFSEGEASELRSMLSDMDNGKEVDPLKLNTLLEKQHRASMQSGEETPGTNDTISFATSVVQRGQEAIPQQRNGLDAVVKAATGNIKETTNSNGEKVVLHKTGTTTHSKTDEDGIYTSVSYAADGSLSMSSTKKDGVTQTIIYDEKGQVKSRIETKTLRNGLKSQIVKDGEGTRQYIYDLKGKLAYTLQRVKTDNGNVVEVIILPDGEVVNTGDLSGVSRFVSRGVNPSGSLTERVYKNGQIVSESITTTSGFPNSQYNDQDGQ